MTQAQRTWNVGEVVRGDDYAIMPAGVFVAFGLSDIWIASLGNGKLEASNGRIDQATAWFDPRRIIARPADAPAHIPHYPPHVSAGVEEQIRMLDKIKAEAECLISERDALKQKLRDAQQACQRLREERDAAQKDAGYFASGGKLRVRYVKPTPAAFTPTLGASPKTREDFAACPVGTIVRFGRENEHWEKVEPVRGECWRNSDKSCPWADDAFMACCSNLGAQITSIPLARKPHPTLGDLIKEHAESRACGQAYVPEWKDHVRIPPAPPVVIRKGQKINTPAQYDALPPGSQVRNANGASWEKAIGGDWWFGWDKMRDLAFPRTVLRIGYDDMHTECAYTPAAPRFKVGQVISTREEYEALPVGSHVSYYGDYTSDTYWEKSGADKWEDRDPIDQHVPRTSLRMSEAPIGRKLAFLP